MHDLNVDASQSLLDKLLTIIIEQFVNLQIFASILIQCAFLVDKWTWKLGSVKREWNLITVTGQLYLQIYHTHRSQQLEPRCRISFNSCMPRCLD